MGSHGSFRRGLAVGDWRYLFVVPVQTSQGVVATFFHQGHDDTSPLSTTFSTKGLVDIMSDSEENEFEDDEPLAGLRKRRSSSSKVNYAEDNDDDDDDEDDVPLSSLASPPKKKKPAASKPTKAKPKAKTTKQPKETTSSAPTSSKPTTDFKSASDALYRSECQKGLLIQRLLVRWWYAIEWPSPKSIPEEAPENYDALDGFPGVFVCSQGEDVGKILDMRDTENKPCFQNMAKKSAEELKTLLVQALEEQKRQLVASEGSGTSTEKELDTLLKWAAKVKPAAADKEAEKVLKAAKMHL
eukprot:Nitzschia sp. Nitz4//scaffold119_size111653//48219//49115//NITZ4_004189-RA/size111653-processed-gene-0.186-mRNA-1//-1//CDS//3329533833//4886//frame0